MTAEKKFPVGQKNSTKHCPPQAKNFEGFAYRKA
jgi:hypothetical protein